MSILNTILPFLVALINISLGIFIWIKSKEEGLKRIFLLLTFSIALWTISDALVEMFLDNNILLSLFSRFVFIPPMFMATFIFYLSIFLDKKRLTHKFFYYIMPITLFINIFFSIFAIFTNQLLHSVSVSNNLSVDFQYGSLTFFYWAYTALLFIITIRNLLQSSFRADDDISKKRNLNILFGIFTSGILIILTNLLLPYLHIGYLSKIGTLSTVLFIFSTAYAIIRYQFLEINITIKKSTIFSGLVIFSGCLYLGFVYGIGLFLQVFFQVPANLVGIVSGLIVAFGLPHIRIFLANVTDKFFFQKKYDYQKILDKIIDDISSISDFDKILELLVDTMFKNMRLSIVGIVAIDYERKTLLSQKWQPFTFINIDKKLKTRSVLLRLLKIHREKITLENAEEIFLEYFYKKANNDEMRQTQLFSTELKEEMAEMQAKVFIPIFYSDLFLGFFAVGSKSSDEDFQKADFDFLRTIIYYTSMIIASYIAIQREAELTKNINLLYSINRLMDSSDNTEEIFHDLLYNITNKMSIDRAILGVVEDDHVKIKAIKATDIDHHKAKKIIKKVDQGIYKRLILNKETIILSAEELEVLELEDRELETFKITSEVLFIPVVIKEKAIGFLAIDNKFTKNSLENVDIVLLGILLNQISVLIENTILQDKSVLQEKKLAEAERLASIGSMSASFAHEIKNPILSLKTFTDLLAKKFDDQSFRKKYLRIVPSEISRINRLVEEMLVFAKDQTINLDIVSIVNIIKSVKEMVKENARQKNIKITIAEFTNLPSVLAVADKITQVILNLVYNAMDAMPNGGEIKISFSVLKEYNKLEVKITDHGIGIAEDKIAKIFEPFYTTKHSGTGIGLAITKKIIMDHGNDVKVESEVGQGSTFSFTLDLA